MALDDPAPPDEGQLLATAQGSDIPSARSAFLALYDLHKGWAYALIRRLLPGLEYCAPDRLQEVFIRLWKRVHVPPPLALGPGETLRPYISSIVRHVIADFLRDPAGAPHINFGVGSLNQLQATQPGWDVCVPSWDHLASPEALLKFALEHLSPQYRAAQGLPAMLGMLPQQIEHAQAEEWSRWDADSLTSAREAFRTLSNRQRDSLILRLMLGLSERQTAEVLGCSESAVGRYVLEGRQRLVPMLALLWHDAGRTLQQIARDLRIDDERDHDGAVIVRREERVQAYIARGRHLRRKE